MRGLGTSREYSGSRLGRRCILLVRHNFYWYGTSLTDTVYTLWHNPRIVPLLYTPLVVVEKLQGGADLMTPGLQRGPPFPKKAVKGAVVGIASLEAPTVPMAVGTCEIDVSSLEKVQGMKGHAVQTFHWAGDELWSWNSAGKPGTDPPEYIEGWDDEKDTEAELASQTAAMDLEDDQDGGGVSLNADPTERSEAEKAQGVDGEDASSLKDSVEEVEDKELSQKGTLPLRLCTQSPLILNRDRRGLHERLPLRHSIPHGQQQGPPSIRP